MRSVLKIKTLPRELRRYVQKALTGSQKETLNIKRQQPLLDSKKRGEVSSLKASGETGGVLPLILALQSLFL